MTTLKQKQVGHRMQYCCRSKYILAFLFVLPVLIFSCKKQSKQDPGGGIAPSANQTFIMNVSVEKKNADKVKAILQNDLLPLAGGISDITALKVFSSPMETEGENFYIMIDMRHADRKGIMLDKTGKVNRIDFSAFISDDYKNTPGFKNLVSLKDFVKSYSLTAVKFNDEFSIDRHALGSVKTK